MDQATNERRKVRGRKQGQGVIRAEELQPNIIVHGPLFPEPVQVIVATPMGASGKLVGKGTRSNSVYELILTAE
jgi:hypothetical protein